jgi:nucleotide-binding universal stress UspA family protein
LGTIMVAWDYGREGARALADAMPILKLAGRVHIVSVFGEKGLNTHCTAADLGKYLSAHAVTYSIETPTLHQGSIGDFLTEQAQTCGADMMVMGAFGHSRLREFVLGGATRSIMREPSLPIFMSH